MLLSSMYTICRALEDIMSNRLTVEMRNADIVAATVLAFGKASKTYAASIPETKGSRVHRLKTGDMVEQFKKAFLSIVTHKDTDNELLMRSREAIFHYIGFIEGMVDTAYRDALMGENGKRFVIELDKTVNMIRTPSSLVNISVERLEQKLAVNRATTSDFERWATQAAIPITQGQDDTDLLAALLQECAEITCRFVASGTRSKDQVHLDYINSLKDPEDLTAPDAKKIIKHHEHARRYLPSHYIKKAAREILLLHGLAADIVKNALDPEKEARARECFERRAGYIEGLAFSRDANPHEQEFTQTLKNLEAVAHCPVFLQNISPTALEAKLAPTRLWLNNIISPT